MTRTATAPAAWGISQYSAVIEQIRSDPVLGRLISVVTPIQSLSGIAGNFANDTSKIFLGTGFVPSERDRMKQWNEYGTGSQGLKRSGLKDDEPSRGIAGVGLVRMLGLCAQLHVEDCPTAPAAPQARGDESKSKLPPPSANLAELIERERPAIHEARGDDKRAADHYRQALHIVRAHPDDFEPLSEATLQRWIGKLDPDITT